MAKDGTVESVDFNERHYGASRVAKNNVDGFVNAFSIDING
jgi:hypothetical protein